MLRLDSLGGFRQRFLNCRGVTPHPPPISGGDMSRPHATANRVSSPTSHLHWETFVTPSIPVVAPDLAPGETGRP
jgi:hypothetical protein